MAEDVQPQTEAQTEPATQMGDPEFDWDKFWEDDAEEPEASTDAGTTTTPPATTAQDDELRSQLAKAQADSARALEIATAAQRQGQMKTAIDAWREQATPAERVLEPLLTRSQTPEELKSNAALVKELSGNINSSLSEQEREVAMRMQREFGMPIAPTNQPSPDSEQIDEKIANGDIAGAINLRMKGFFG
jgi:hypothetical protein